MDIKTAREAELEIVRRRKEKTCGAICCGFNTTSTTQMIARAVLATACSDSTVGKGCAYT